MDGSAVACGYHPPIGLSLQYLLEYLSRPETRAKVQDLVDVPYLQMMKENPLALLVETVNCLEHIPELSDMRLVVWFHEFQVIGKIDNLLLKGLRAIFQNQTHVCFSFTGSEQTLLTLLFAYREQAFYDLRR